MIDNCDEIISDSSLKLKNALPTGNDIKEIIKYTEENSLLLYPFEQKSNPFAKNELKKRINNKSEYLMSLAFSNPEQSFFSDPLLLSGEIFQNANDLSKGKYSTKFNGVVSSNNKAYIKILKAGFFGDDYSKDRELKNIDTKLVKLAKESGNAVFLYSPHLYYLQSRDTIDFDIKLIFILTTVLTVLIFYYFFKNLTLLIFSLTPIIGGFALTFFIISIFKKELVQSHWHSFQHQSGLQSTTQ